MWSMGEPRNPAMDMHTATELEPPWAAGSPQLQGQPENEEEASEKKCTLTRSSTSDGVRIRFTDRCMVSVVTDCGAGHPSCAFTASAEAGESVPRTADPGHRSDQKSVLHSLHRCVTLVLALRLNAKQS